ncbi:related to GIT1 - Glycerophosphoinositol transporter also able to mediate low-affinity phosphate transport [Melanopsichium pennsylvanicum]|uniref:Related to GIT1 - Glycerophosphoinositol transporter also able to mediate low-affinity phosphate transport n=2 Tax=Melanopsichium pennsylvanicum TaxID=63383 RepID=A0AAJ4XJ86_9BASI|nr:related to GIT1-Glycerophosphoinositol transporter also able to mediate low-affinity phosphate transport [Melanopsichium pennsylvanicum 4]SNX82971.1 related to GIT1 - Glycerophosphoinositol transporter also able to mediate low-affinity phosphate transport [Melanopsichium pennsylvanicum]
MTDIQLTCPAEISPTGEKDARNDSIDASVQPLAGKKGLGAVALIFACGSALFSDGYVNSASGPALTVLSYANPDAKGFSAFESRFSSLVFAGTVFGMLLFGFLVDRFGRRYGMWFASIWLALWSVLIAGAWGAGGSVGGLFAALSAYRFIIGIAIGAEYPSGSVAASENTEGEGVAKNRQQMYFIIATNTMIDLGFVVAALVSYILLLIFGMNHLAWVWRLTLGLGAIPPLLVFFFRIGIKEPDHFRKGAIKTGVPYWLIFKRYWVRLLAVCLAWFMYDYVSYPSGIFSSLILKQLNPGTGSDYDTLKRSLAYSTALNCFYLPGTIAGAFVSDRLGPKLTMIIGLLIQAVLAFIMGGAFGKVRESFGGYVTLYGLFLAFGEFGPGNNLGLLASKACGPAAVRGTFYGIAAAIGKVGAFSGSYAYPQIQADLGTPNDNIYFAGPFYIAGGLAIFSSIITFFFIPTIGQDSMKAEDKAFRQYLADNGYDVSQMGLCDSNSPAQFEEGAARTQSDKESLGTREKANEAHVISAPIN